MNPRLVKEANALANAGYRVHVIAARFARAMDPLDRDILRDVAWSFEQVECRDSPRARSLKLLRRGLRLVERYFPLQSLALANLAHDSAVPLLAAAAAATHADLYIGHCVSGLAAVRRASARNGTPFAFDAEDFHSDETAFSVEDPVESRVLDLILRDALPHCRHITAASPLIADAFAEKYSIRRPTPVLNVFPLNESPAAPTAAVDSDSRKLYWFSQTIGPNRGLELILTVLAAMKTPCELHLRGIEATGFRQSLAEEARRVGFLGSIQFHPIAAANEMARLAAPYDLGLSLELTTPRNRDLCLTNKIFTYLLAGIPVAMTPTTAQSELAAELGDAAVMLDLTDPISSARRLDVFFADRASFARSKEKAWALGQQRFNWDFEREKLLQLFQQDFEEKGVADALSDLQNRPAAASDFRPGLLLRLFERLRVPRKLGVGESLFQRGLARRSITWVDFGSIRWKLNLANDTHRWLVYGEYEEPGVRRILERVLNPDSVVVDSGANIGQMVLMYLRCGNAAKIHAFEPTPEAREWLEECVSANGLSQVTVSPLALGERAGTENLQVNFALQEGARNFIDRKADGLPIEVTTLDAYADVNGIERIRFWKLDTEGHELAALRGAASLLRAAAIDYIYVETADAGAAIAAFMEELGYVPVSLGLARVFTRAEVAAKFTNIFVSRRVAHDECHLHVPHV